MAIISCPECGEKISDSVKQCIHCGVNIVTCKECGKIYTKAVHTCSECGYVFQETSAPSPKNECKSSKNVIAKWEEGNILRKFYYHGYISIALIILSVIFLGIAAITLFTWSDILKTEDTFSRIKTLIVFSALFYVAKYIYDYFGNYFKIISLSHWIAQNKIDTKSILHFTINQDFDSMTLDEASAELSGCQWCLRGMAFSKNVLLRTNYQKYLTIQTCLSAVVAIFIAIFCAQNTETYMAAEILQSDILDIPGFELSMIENWWMLIVAAGAFVANYFMDKYAEKLLEKGEKDYIQQMLPDCKERYKKYVAEDGFSSYIADRVGKAYD